MINDMQKIEITKESIFGAQNYAPLSVVLEKGKGEFLWDVEGVKYLDMMSAYSAVSHGHSHPELIRIIKEQVEKLSVVSRAYYTKNLGDFLETLTKITKMDRALVMNTGAEAVETAIKAARRWGYFNKAIPENKAEIIVADGNFHGRTTTIVGFSSDPDYKKGFGPFTPGFKMANYCTNHCSCSSKCEDSIESFKKLINKNTCAILVEPIQGEGGINVPRKGWLKQLSKLCKENNILLLVDEIQSGLGRTGKLFAFNHENIKPDGVIIGKALGGGMLPISAFLSSQDVMDNFNPGSHGSTFGGNPLAAAVGKRSLELLYEDNLIENSKALGAYLKKELINMDLDIIKEVRGEGLWLGVEILSDRTSAKNLCKELMLKQVLTKETHETVIRFAPPLMISKENIDLGLEKINEVFTTYRAKKISAKKAS
ncbi:ornithine--oxo-acid transaminase [SAR86 cluster bacterium]|jgi:ornithine--oxo-acid transaminase|nr:ornithine--oxo-acid transaminase [SAR86 cluster bacterium]